MGQAYPQLREMPFYGSNIGKLRGYKPATWPYRVGNCPSFFHVDDSAKIVYLLTVEKRADAFRQGKPTSEQVAGLFDVRVAGERLFGVRQVTAHTAKACAERRFFGQQEQVRTRLRLCPAQEQVAHVPAVHGRARAILRLAQRDSV